MTDDEKTDPGSTTISDDCADCGGNMRWDPAVFELVCVYCGSSKRVEADGLPDADVGVEDFEQNQETEVFLATSRRLRCNQCGAVIDFHGAVASRCEFCDAHAIAEIHEHAEAVRPSGIIPFAVDRDAAKEAYRDWIEEQPLLPKPIREGVPLEELRGVYLPFWVFDVRVLSSCSARCGYRSSRDDVHTPDNLFSSLRSMSGHHEREHIHFQTRQKTMDNRRTGVGVYGSTGLPSSLMNQLAPWYAESANAWKEAFLRGFPAEAPQMSPTEAWGHAKTQIERIERQDFYGAFGADVVDDLKLRCGFEGARVQLIYMPVWVAAYRFKGRVFRFLVNGRTGEAAGQAPFASRQFFMMVSVALIVFVLLILPGLCALFDIDCDIGPEPEIPGASPIEFDPGDGKALP